MMNHASRAMRSACEPAVSKMLPAQFMASSWLLGLGRKPARCSGARRLRRRALLVYLVLHVVVAAGARRLGREARERTNVRRDLPQLLVGDASAERRHPVRPTVDDRGDDVLGIAPVDPFVIHERRTHTTAAVRVA